MGGTFVSMLVLVILFSVANHRFMTRTPLPEDINNLMRSGLALGAIVLMILITICATSWFSRIRLSMRLVAVFIICTGLFKLVSDYGWLFSRYGIRDTTAEIPVIRHDEFAGIYFSIITITTVGYGDFVCVTDECRFTAAVEAVSGYLLFALTIAVVVTFLQQLGRVKDDD